MVLPQSYFICGRWGSSVLGFLFFCLIRFGDCQCCRGLAAVQARPLLLVESSRWEWHRRYLFRVASWFILNIKFGSSSVIHFRPDGTCAAPTVRRCNRYGHFFKFGRLLTASAERRREHGPWVQKFPCCHVKEISARPGKINPDQISRKKKFPHSVYIFFRFNIISNKKYSKTSFGNSWTKIPDAPHKTIKIEVLYFLFHIIHKNKIMRWNSFDLNGRTNELIEGLLHSVLLCQMEFTITKEYMSANLESS